MKGLGSSFIGALISIIGLLICSKSAFSQSVPTDKDYKRKAGIAGTVTSVGSDTLANVMALWSQEFKQLYPQVKFQIQASGSATAPPALTEGTASIGPMSRAMKNSEINYFISKHGYPPTVVKVAIDAIAIFVNRRNSLTSLTREQLDSLFSITRYCGGARGISQWSQLGVELGDNKFIRLFGRNSVSGTYGLFKQAALCGGDFLPIVNEMPGSESVVQSVAFTPGAIGYAAYGHKSAGVKALSIENQSGQMIDVNEKNIASGLYPLSRYLYLVINKAPDQSLPDLEAEFIRFVLSDIGQQLVKRDGYIPVEKDVARRQLNRLLQH